MPKSKKNMQNLALVKPGETYAEEIAAFRQELIDQDSRFDGTGGLKNIEDPQAYIEECRRMKHRETVPKGMVPASQYLLVDADTDTVIGMVNIRHELNDALARLGGHIGYVIRPQYRRQGYAEMMLGMALMICREELKLSEVMISCHKENTASEHTILACGGKLNRIVIDPETGKEACIYTIPLKEETHGESVS